MSHQTSFWESQVFYRQADVIIIGSGFVGLQAGIRLLELHPKWRVLILERGRIPSGASTKNGGFACFGSPTELLDDLNNIGPTATWDLVAQRWQGLQYLRESVGDQAMDYLSTGGVELFREADQVAYQDSLNALPTFNKALQSITGQAETYQKDEAAGRRFGGQPKAIHIAAEGQIQPAKAVAVLQGIFQRMGGHILYGSEVTAIEHNPNPNLQLANGPTLSAERVLVATNGFAHRLLGDSLDVQPARNQVIITRPIPDLDWRGNYHYDQGYYYFRTVGNRILLGGGRNLDKAGEATDHFGLTDLIQDALHELMSKLILPGQSYEVEQRWSGILGIGPNKKPIIQQTAPGVVVAVRLGGMGVAIGSLVGRKAADLLTSL